MLGPPDGDTWTGLATEPLPAEAALAWCVLPRCGGLVLFMGTVRDHAEGRPGVVSVDYEAYAEQAGARLERVAESARDKWPELGRLVILHRTGLLSVTEASVLVVASAPHRDEAFSAARFCIDTVKTSVPIWKAETWSGGVDWGTGAHDLSEEVG